MSASVSPSSSGLSMDASLIDLKLLPGLLAIFTALYRRCEGRGGDNTVGLIKASTNIFAMEDGRIVRLYGPQLLFVTLFSSSVNDFENSISGRETKSELGGEKVYHSLL